MFKKMKLILVLFLTLISLESTNVLAWGGLKSQEVNGFSRYCTYTDGGVLTVGSAEVCPTNNSAVSEGSPSPTINIENRNGGFGALIDQRVNGLSRYCSYSDGAVLTVGSATLCPVTDQ
jgi:hypothetical protein